MNGDGKPTAVSLDVELLNAWTLMKVSGCAKSCLLSLLMDSPYGALSSLTRYQLAMRLKLSYGRSTVNDAVDCLKREGLIFVDSATKKLGIRRDVLSGRPDEFRKVVSELNVLVKVVEPECQPVTKHIQTSPREHIESVSSGNLYINSGGPDVIAGEPNVKSGEPCVSDGKPDDKSGEPNTVNGNPDALSEKPDYQLSDDNVLRCLNLMMQVFVPFFARKQFVSEQKTLAEIQNIKTTPHGLLSALAIIYQAVKNGEYIEDLTKAIAEAQLHPELWPSKDPIRLLWELNQDREKKKRIQQVNDALNSARVEA